MFTGIIESIGTIRAMTPKGGDVRVLVETGKLDLSDVKLGDSIAVNGVCLTAVELPGNGPQVPYAIVIGTVVGVHIDDRVVKDGRVDMLAFKPVGRLGYSEYTTVDNVWRMRRPE